MVVLVPPPLAASTSNERTRTLFSLRVLLVRFAAAPEFENTTVLPLTVVVAIRCLPLFNRTRRFAHSHWSRAQTPARAVGLASPRATSVAGRGPLHSKSVPVVAP